MNHPNRRMAATAGAVAALLAVTTAADVMAKEKKASKEKAKTESGYIGVYMQELTSDVKKGLDLKGVEEGVLISGVQDDSPAEKAGLEEGDVVISFGGKDVATPDQLRDAVREFQPGAEAKLEAVRDGKTKSFTLTIGEKPDDEVFSWSSPDVDVRVPGMNDMHRAFAIFGGPRLGIDAHEIEDDELGSYFGAKEGILVLDVEDESVAAKAGVKAGDVIRTIDDDTVADVRDLRDALKDFDEGDEFTIGVVRKGKTQSLKAVMDEQEFSFHNGGANSYMFRAPRAPRAPRVHVDRESLRDEIDELKKEIQEMKEQLDREDS